MGTTFKPVVPGTTYGSRPPSESCLLRCLVAQHCKERGCIIERNESARVHSETWKRYRRADTNRTGVAP